MKYAVKLVAEYEIEAENVAAAMRVARKAIRSIGERSGASRTNHERDFTGYKVARIAETLTIPRRVA